MAIDLLSVVCGDALHHDNQVEQRGHVDTGGVRNGRGARRSRLDRHSPGKRNIEARVVGRLDDPQFCVDPHTIHDDGTTRWEGGLVYVLVRKQEAPYSLLDVYVAGAILFAEGQLP